MIALTNNEVKDLKQLKLKKHRLKERCFVIEGEKIIQEAIEKRPDLIREVIITTEMNNVGIFAPFTPKVVAQKQMAQISSLKTPPTSIAVVDFVANKGESEFVIALDGIQNPGNLGTIIRLSSWFGCYKIIASEDTVDVYNPKVIQATMGSVFDVSIEYCDLVKYLNESSLSVYGADIKGTNLYEQQKIEKGILVMGSEGKGISEEVSNCISEFITIPKFGKGESLNVAMATGIILSELKRKTIVT